MLRILVIICCLSSQGDYNQYKVKDVNTGETGTLITSRDLNHSDTLKIKMNVKDR